jgi:hypothetical protein
MNQGAPILSQFLAPFPHKFFQRSILKHAAEHRVHHFSSWNQFFCMTYGQITQRDSLRDIALCLNTCFDKVRRYHFKTPIARSTLADANESRSYKVYEDVGWHLIKEAQRVHKTIDDTLTHSHIAYALDSTTVDLCLSVYPWASFRSTKSGIKIHTLLDVQTQIPTFIRITEAKVNDVNALDHIVIEPGAIYILDRAYLDFRRLWNIRSKGAFFVTRLKDNTLHNVLGDRPPIGEGIIFDKNIRLVGKSTSLQYIDALRLVRSRDKDTGKEIDLVTNLMDADASTIADIYRSRWRVELFFKWIKQHLAIKKFFGQSENAVRTQIWIAVITYLLLGIVKVTNNIALTMLELAQVIEVHAFERIELNQLVTAFPTTSTSSDQCKQLTLF